MGVGASHWEVDEPGRGGTKTNGEDAV